MQSSRKKQLNSKSPLCTVKNKTKQNRKNGCLWRDEDSCISGLDDKDVISLRPSMVCVEFIYRSHLQILPSVFHILHCQH